MFPLLRSLAIYYGRPDRLGRLKRHYAPFIPQGGLAFDAGAHVGTRSRAFLALGARVVAIEPQPGAARFLRRILRKPIGTGRIAVEEQALGQEESMVELHPEPGDLTAATTVRRTTLDALIQRHGIPDFVKIDMDGREDVVLAGLSRPIPTVSYKFLPADRDVAYHATLRLERLSVEGGVAYEYNFSLGEELRLVMTGRWWSAAELQEYLSEIPADGPSGDIYARIVRG